MFASTSAKASASANATADKTADRQTHVDFPAGRAVLPYDHTAITSVSSAESASAKATVDRQATLTSAEQAAGWKLLFDGKTTKGWRGFKKPAFPPADGRSTPAV